MMTVALSRTYSCSCLLVRANAFLRVLLLFALWTVITTKAARDKQRRVYTNASVIATPVATSGSTIEVMRLDAFPRSAVALHFSCPESNMFATNCACHLRCRTTSCKDAIQLCEKYRDSKGCRYVLLRGGANNRIATLKRVPNQDETRQFDLSRYPQTSLELQSSMAWKSLVQTAKLPKPPGPMLGDLVLAAGSAGKRLVDSLTNYHSSSQSRLKYCPENAHPRNSSWQANFLSTSSISMFAVSYQAPKTLLNSLRTWNSSGLLSMMRENVIILNDPAPVDLGIAADFNLRVLEPRDIPNAKRSKPNVLTIGAAFYYALRESHSEYLLFLENDFKMDTALSREAIMLELIAAVGLLERGVEIVRLLSRKHQGCGTFKSCDHGGIDLETQNSMDRRRNWFAFYCRDHPGSQAYVSTCLETPEFRCFTSWDSNWSLNAVLVKRSTMLSKKYPVAEGSSSLSPGGDKSIGEIGLEQYTANDGFESTMSWGVKWMRWHVPMCISYQGLFLHEEIETGA